MATPLRGDQFTFVKDKGSQWLSFFCRYIDENKSLITSSLDYKY